MSKSKEPCGCVSDDTHWLSLCPVHEAERGARFREGRLDSLQWLMNHYDRFPNEDNLHHVVIRLKDVGTAANSRPTIVRWVLAHAEQIRKAAVHSHGSDR